MSLTAIQQEFAEYTAAYESGELPRDEYLNLLQGLEVEQVIAETAEELEFKTNLNAAINVAISAASVIA